VTIAPIRSGATLPLDLPYSDANHTCGRVNDYSATCLGSYDGGEDIIYEITVTADICVDISVTPDASWVGLGIGDTCPLGRPLYRHFDEQFRQPDHRRA